VSIQKTKAEEAISTQFVAVAGQLPGIDAVARSRKHAIAAFNKDGLPHRRIEAWKYTDLRVAMKSAFEPAVNLGISNHTDWQAIAEVLGPFADLDVARVVLVDGVYVPELSAVEILGGDVQIMPLAAALSDECFADMHVRPPRIEQDHAIAELNTAFMTDGAAVQISQSTSKPLHIINVARGTDERMIATRNVISVGDDVEATIIESFVALGSAATQTNALTHIAVGERSHVHHIKVQEEAMASTHLSTWIVEVSGEANYRGFQFSTGAALSRNQISVSYGGEGGKVDISGAYLLADRQHCDTTLVVEHPVPNCESRELFKAVLDDEARGVFQGKVIVRAEAQKTDGKQMAQALMLSEACEFDSKPELEIYADDVVCGHGATCAEIDPDLVFYCRSRGIPEDQARGLIIQSFIAEAIAKVEDPAIADVLSARANSWLERDRT